MYVSEINAGTYWSAGELRTLDRLAKEGRTPQEIAITMKRTVGGIKQRLSIIRTSYLFQLGGDSDTLVSTRKNPTFNFGRKDDMSTKKAKAKSALKIIKTGRS